MKNRDDDSTVTFPVSLDLITVERLMRLAEVCQDAPTRIMASILHDVLKDDASENGEAVPPGVNHLH